MRDAYLCDVDSILWPFEAPAFEEAKKIVPDFPSPAFWNRWDIFTHGGIPREDLAPMFRRAHEKQKDYAPFPGANEMLNLLSDHGQIIIASHRDPDSRYDLEAWLRRHQLPYDEIYVGDDKCSLFICGNIDLVIDDAPQTLLAAQQWGITSIGLSWPWNIGAPCDGLFPDLWALTAWLREWFREREPKPVKKRGPKPWRYV